MYQSSAMSPYLRLARSALATTDSTARERTELSKGKVAKNQQVMLFRHLKVTGIVDGRD